MDRRSWLQLMAILTAAQEAQSQQRGGATAPSAEGPERGGRGESAVPNPPMRVTKQQVIGALILMGLEFQDAELEMMMRGVYQALSSYETLRKADVPIDTAPAFAFHPGLPDRQPVKGPQRFDTTIAKAPATKAPSNLEDVAFWRVVDLAPLVKARAISDRQPVKGPQRFDTTIAKAPATKAPSNLEDVAFWRVVDLAPLVKARAISSTDLTKMYLARMRKYSPKLLCLITSTEDLALEQAAAADK